jgi:four helix bundle protein
VYPYRDFFGGDFQLLVAPKRSDGGSTINPFRPASPKHQPLEFAKFEELLYLRGWKKVDSSGTSVGANYREASRGRSKAKFISKIGDYLKEIEETEYWLKLVVDSCHIPAPQMAELLDKTRQLIAIFTTINKNAKG